MKASLRLVRTIGLLAVLYASHSAVAQTLPGDNVVFGPMLSPVYNNSVRVWVLTENKGTGNQVTLEFSATSGRSAPLAGKVFQSDDRLGYSLRSYLYSGLAVNETYAATLRVNGQVLERSATIKNESGRVDDFSFLSGGCGRIYDLSRCIDRPESQTHKNGDPKIFDRMAQENSDLMVWLGDATYLLGLQHAGGQCPDAIDDWANRDTAFARYMFYRQFHDKLLQSMPQLAITDNHDTGPNEFNKTLPSLGEMKENFMEWWPNPEYLSTTEGQGLFSSYRYKDVEYFLFDNRSYRDDTTHHLGPEQFEWLKGALLKSTATYKILVNGTPSFAKHWGGRNFSITEQGDALVKWIQDNNIDGVISFSADIHEQEFYGLYGGVNYPLFDVLSGNLNSDVGDGNFTVDYGSDSILRGTKQTYLKISVYGDPNDRRMKVQYQDLNGQPYFEEIIHEDMLKSDEEDTRKLGLSFSGTLQDSSANRAKVSGSVRYIADRHGKRASAAALDYNGLTVDNSAKASLNDRTFSIGFWLQPKASLNASIIFSNGSPTGGVTLAVDPNGRLQYIDHATANVLTVANSVAFDRWQHVLWKYDNVKRELSLYQNGLLAQSWKNVPAPRASGEEIHLGRSFQGGYLHGALDELNVYGKLLPDEVIKELAEYEPNGSEVIQLSGAQSIAIPGDRINPALAGDFTIEFWGRLDADPSTNAKIVASNARVNGNSTGISFEFPDSNRLNVVLGTNGSGWNTISEAGQPWKVGEWNHVAVTAKRNGNLVLFVNGEPIGQTTFTGYVPNTTGLGFGDSPYYGSDVRAQLDELRVWNRALSADEINKGMHTPASRAATNLALYYDFNGVGASQAVSKGTDPYAVTLVGGKIVDGTSPVQRLPRRFRNVVAANWSAKNETGAGLYLSDPITNLNSNLLIGYKRQRTPSWLVKPANLVSGNMSVDLDVLFSHPKAITAHASRFWLVQGDPRRRGEGKRIEGVADGNVIRFANVPLLDTATFYLVWSD